MTPLLAVSELLRGVTYKKEVATSQAAPGRLPVLRANNLQGRAFDLSDLVYVPSDLVSAQQRIRSGDVIIATSSGSISVVGKAVQSQNDMDAGFGAFCGALRPAPALDARYFGHFFSTEDYRTRVSAMARGSNINNLKREHFEALTFPVAPQAEQKRISDKLDALLARVDACHDRLARVASLLKRFRQSVLAAATSGRLTEDWRGEVGIDVWATARLKDVVRSIDQGWSPKCESMQANSDDEWAVIKTTSIQPIHFLDFENKRLPSNLSPRPGLELQPGDVLITRAGPRARAGVTCLVVQTRPRLMLCDKAYRLRLDEHRMQPAFLNFMLNSSEMVERIDALKTGISESGVNLTQDRFLAVSIAVPSLDEQTEIVRRVETLFAFADRLEGRLAQAQTAVDRLTPSLLAKAFRGELVPQDPEDEPAAELLKRLSAQRAAAPPTLRKARRSQPA